MALECIQHCVAVTRGSKKSLSSESLNSRCGVLLTEMKLKEQSCVGRGMKQEFRFQAYLLVISFQTWQSPHSIHL